MITKYTNDYGKEVYSGVTLETPFDPDLFIPAHAVEDDHQLALHTNIGSITVLDRMTGFGWRDVETGYRDLEGKFWLASGDIDVRYSDCKTFGESIEWIKARANNCVGV